MCNQLRCIAIAFVMATPCAGQTLGRLKAEADSLAREWRQANALADLQDSLRKVGARAGRDTIRAGALTILVNPSPLPVAQAAARTWPVIEHLYGPMAASVTDRNIIIEAIDPDTIVPPPPIGAAAQVRWNLGRPRLTQWLLNYVSAAAADRALRDWLGGPLLYDTAAAAAAAPHVYVDLVTRPWRILRRCFLGDTPSCRIALSVGDTTALLVDGYDAPERRSLVVDTYQGFFNHGSTERDFRACAAGGDSVCLQLLQGLEPGRLIRPLGYSARLSLVALALRAGGDGAMGRLLAAPERSMAGRLSDASGMDIDSLTARWLWSIRAARPTPVSLPPWGTWLALGWIGFFATCGLRSSRWRAS